MATALISTRTPLTPSRLCSMWSSWTWLGLPGPLDSPLLPVSLLVSSCVCVCVWRGLPPCMFNCHFNYHVLQFVRFRLFHNSVTIVLLCKCLPLPCKPWMHSLPLNTFVALWWLTICNWRHTSSRQTCIRDLSPTHSYSIIAVYIWDCSCVVKTVITAFLTFLAIVSDP